jgi:hypothetical protein
VERALFATRVLERGTPWDPTDAEVEAALRRVPPTARTIADLRPRWPVLVGLGVAVAAVLDMVRVPPSEFAERGTGEGRAVLRVFCADPAQGHLQELPPGGRCGVGLTLAFAAGAESELTSVALRLRDAEGSRLIGPFTVTGRPGREAPLETTPELRSPGSVEVIAAFASSPEAAVSSLVGTPAAGAVVLRQSATVDRGSSPVDPRK